MSLTCRIECTILQASKLGGLTISKCLIRNLSDLSKGWFSRESMTHHRYSLTLEINRSKKELRIWSKSSNLCFRATQKSLEFLTS